MWLTLSHFILVGLQHQTIMFLPLPLAGQELRNIVPAEGAEGDAQPYFEDLITVDYFSTVES